MTRVWTPAALAALTVDRGFRLRGGELTRLESLTDGAFALALTFLVIASNEVPNSFDALLAAFKQVPAFAASFGILLLFWVPHVRWSRRYGMDDGPAIALTALTIFVVLVFVFPLKVVLSAFLSQISSGALPSLARLQSMDQLSAIFIAYGCGFTLLSFSLFGLYRLALRRADALGLNALERFDTQADAGSHFISVLIGLFATGIAVVLPPQLSPLAGYSYFAIAIERPLYWRRMRRRRATLVESLETAAS